MGASSESRWEQEQADSGQNWLRDQKQEGEEPLGAAANSRLSLSSKLFAVTFLAVLCSWVMYWAQPNLIN